MSWRNLKQDYDVYLIKHIIKIYSKTFLQNKYILCIIQTIPDQFDMYTTHENKLLFITTFWRIYSTFRFLKRFNKTCKGSVNLFLTLCYLSINKELHRVQHDMTITSQELPPI